MITASGYSKDKGIRPEAIVVTFGEDMMMSKPGGKDSFISHFEASMQHEDGLWLHRCKHQPQFDIVNVYVIANNTLLYKCIYGGHQTGEAEIFNADSSSEVISWPRLILAGPVEKAPFYRKLSGFRGFRYATKLF